jgi:hypothetical protein
MAFPEKAASTPRLEPEKAASAPPFPNVESGEKAVSDHLNSGQDALERRHPDRSNLIESNLKSLTLEDSKIERGAVAAPNAPPPSSRLATPPPAPRPMFQPIQPRPFNNRGEYELLLAKRITEAGGDGWAVLMALDEARVAALCRRLKNGVLTQQEINELCAPRRAVVARG